jgi:hypothetical protein
VIASDACAAALWETAWPAHPNKGACTKHELFVVYVCERSERSQKISVMVHGEHTFTWIPAKRAHEKMLPDRRKGWVSHESRPQSEFCKFVLECFKHGHSKAQDSYTTPIKNSYLLEARAAVSQQWSARKAAAAAAAASCRSESGGSDGGGEYDSSEGVGESEGGGVEDEADDNDDDDDEYGDFDDDWKAEQGEREEEEPMDAEE